MRDMYTKAMRAMKGKGTPVAKKDSDRLKRQMKKLKSPSLKTAQQTKDEAMTKARKKQKEAMK